MSNTRRAKDTSVFHQSRYASSEEFERGLIANLVAKRCALLPNPRDRELIWFIQYLSHLQGGLSQVASDLIKYFRGRMGPAAALQCDKKQDGIFSADEIRSIRVDLPAHIAQQLPLRGEICRADRADLHRSKLAAKQALLEIQDDSLSLDRVRELERQIQIGRLAEAKMDTDMAAAQKQVDGYPVATVLAHCLDCAEFGGQCGDKTESLERELARLCLDPATSLSVGPWYFYDLINCLREYQNQWQQAKAQGHVTSLGKIVCDELDFTLETRSLSLLEGGARMGKSFAAKGWCEQHPGQARFVEVSSGNDEASFFRDIARSLGLGNFLNYKVVQIRERVESVLLTGDILLVLDEAQRLWPERRVRDGFPSRVVWVMTMVNKGVPICMISTPQFITAQNAFERSGWNSAQLTGRISNYRQLPAELDATDLMAVGRVALPHASNDVLKVLAIYARCSARYLAAVDSISKRAQYIARRQGRDQCTAEDVQMAMKESVIPSDNRLLTTLEQANKASGRRRQVMPPAPELETENPRRVPMSAKDVRPVAPVESGFGDRAGVGW